MLKNNTEERQIGPIFDIRKDMENFHLEESEQVGTTNTKEIPEKRGLYQDINILEY